MYAFDSYVPKKSDSPLWYYDDELKRLYMSAYHLNKDTIGMYIDKINSGNYQTICTYPSSAYILACLCEENNLNLSQIEKIHVTSEKMLNQWYKKVVDVFGIKPCGHYGQMEKVSFMHQIENSQDYHQNYAQNNSLKYNFYRYSCQRDQRLDEVWGDNARKGSIWK